MKERRIETEKKVVSIMIRIYGKEKALSNEDIENLENYTHRRLEHCHYGNDKPMCSFCPIHCYAPPMRKKIQAVMRYAGPRMLFHAPITTVRHIWQTLVYKLSPLKD